jgi:hypothetical protein
MKDIAVSNLERCLTSWMHGDDYIRGGTGLEIYCDCNPLAILNLEKQAMKRTARSTMQIHRTPSGQNEMSLNRVSVKGLSLIYRLIWTLRRGLYDIFVRFVVLHSGFSEKDTLVEL